MKDFSPELIHLRIGWGSLSSTVAKWGKHLQNQLMPMRCNGGGDLTLKLEKVRFQLYTTKFRVKRGIVSTKGGGRNVRWVWKWTGGDNRPNCENVPKSVLKIKTGAPGNFKFKLWHFTGFPAHKTLRNLLSVTVSAQEALFPWIMTHCPCQTHLDLHQIWKLLTNFTCALSCRCTLNTCRPKTSSGHFC